MYSRTYNKNPKDSLNPLQPSPYPSKQRTNDHTCTPYAGPFYTTLLLELVPTCAGVEPAVDCAEVGCSCLGVEAAGAGVAEVVVDVTPLLLLLGSSGGVVLEGAVGSF